MFTGIIEEIGSLATVLHQGRTLQLVINAREVIKDIHRGDSIAVNGVCLTVTSFNRSSFTADVMPVTYHDTSLASLKTAAKVNLERAMAANGRFGGHIVSGHVDGVGRIINKTRLENSILYQIKIPAQLSHYCIAKGSIALDGTSLTIVEAASDWLSVALIPHSQEKSLLGSQGLGALVNVECDILAKQQQKSRSKQTISHAFLEEHGFI